MLKPVILGVVSTFLFTSNLNAADQIPNFSSMIVFGDSSEDTGNWHQLALRIAPSFANSGPHYDDGRFTNGRVWTEYLSELLELPVPTASELPGANNTNYAWGAATSGAVRRVNSVDDIDEQFVKYQRDHSPTADELFVVSVGGNDVLASPAIDPEEILNHIVDHIEKLHNLGADNFFLNTIRALPNGSNLTKIRQLNHTMRDRVPRLRDELETNIFFSDFEQFLDEVVANKEEYGFTNVIDNACDCLNADQSRKPHPRIVNNPDEYLQWDGHLTARGYEVLARHALEAFEVPGDYDRNGGLGQGDLALQALAIQTNDLAFDANRDGSTNLEDRIVWVRDLRKTWIGDANLDGEFNSSDFTEVFQAGEYEDNITLNSYWAEGDWNGDGEFDSSDLIVAFQDGGYEAGPRMVVASVPEPSSVLLITIAIFGLAGVRRVHSA